MARVFAFKKGKLRMLLAYVDEIGETGAFVAPDHPRFNTSPAFGYAGFVVPDFHARLLGSFFTREKRSLFATELLGVENPGFWERKGADMLRPDTPDTFPQHIRVLNGIVQELVQKRKGKLFYHACEKPRGSPKQTNLDKLARRDRALREMTNRLARYANSQQEQILIMMDAVQEKERKSSVQTMYAHILGRASAYSEMHRLVEPPMHIDSELSSNIQLADWIAGLVGRAINYQLVKESRYEWVSEDKHFPALYKAFTHESKLELHSRSVDHIHHYEVMHKRRRLYPTPNGHTIGGQIDEERMDKMRRIAEATAQKS